MTDTATSDAGTRPYPDKWARESATPTVQAFHSAIRKIVAERFAESGKAWEECVHDPAFELTREDFEKVEADLLATGYRFEMSAVVSVTEAPEKYKPIAAPADTGEHETDEDGRPIVGSGDNVFRAKEDVTGTARFVSNVETVMEMLMGGVPDGTVVRDSDDAAPGTVLARPTTSPEDVGGMIAARAVVTERGGATSHAAVVTRALGRPSVVGVGDDVTAGWAGREVTVDGSAGFVYAGVLPTEEVRSSEVPGLDTLIDWARELSPVGVVDSAADVLDLDAAGFSLDPEAEPDVDALTERMRGAAAVTGSILSTPAGARAVLRSGVPVVVRLPGQHAAVLLLRLVQEAKEEKAP